MLPKILKQVKVFVIANQREIALGIAVFLISVISFGLGQISAKLPKESPIIVQNLPSEEAINTEIGESMVNAENSIKSTQANLMGAVSKNTDSSSPVVVASKNGTKYHYPWCPGALRIKEENKITFQTIEEAKTAGYEPAANCPGLE